MAPKRIDPTNDKRVMIRMPEQMYDDADHVAEIESKKRGVSLSTSWALRFLIMLGLEAWKEEQRQ